MPTQDCECTPTSDRGRALFPRPLSRRAVLRLGLVGAVTMGVLGVSAAGPPAFADDYPTWEDVLAAQGDEAAKAAEVSRIQGLIEDLQQSVDEARTLARAAGDAYYQAQQAFFDAADRARDIQARADEETTRAEEAAQESGRVATQMSRAGGEDASMELFFSGSAKNADELLHQLSELDRLLARNDAVHEKAISARDTAALLGEQAVIAREERDRLQREAEEKMVEAQAAADAEQAALEEQSERLVVLDAQLAALQDTTVKTIAEYEAGVAERRRQEEERKQRERDAAPAPGSSGGGVSGSGWARPHDGYVSSSYGPRIPDCDAWGCSSSNHRGTDFAAGCGTPIYAAAAGTVDMAFYNGGYGNFIRIQHGDGVATGYAHIVEGGYNVWNGQRVEAGQVIAYAGDTGTAFGCNLHFEVYIWGDTTDPSAFLGSRGVYI